MTLPHPTAGELELTTVLAVLGDPTRLAIVSHLAGLDGRAATCTELLVYASKTNLSYHLARLREAGVTWTEIQGTSRRVTLRRDDLESRFPGLLGAVLGAAAPASEGRGHFRAGRASI